MKRLLVLSMLAFPVSAQTPKLEQDGGITVTYDKETVEHCVTQGGCFLVTKQKLQEVERAGVMRHCGRVASATALPVFLAVSK